MPILPNNEDHFDFDEPVNNFVAAVQSYASLGFFDYKPRGEMDLHQGFQSLPVDWRISSEGKKGFFSLLMEITNGK